MDIKNHFDIKQDEIMTVKEMAQYMKFSERTILRLIKLNKIPVIKIANQWRFIKSIVDQWLITNTKNFDSESNS